MLSLPDDVDISVGLDALTKCETYWHELAMRGVKIGVFDNFAMIRIAARAAVASGSDPVIVVVKSAGVVKSILALRRQREFATTVAVPLNAPLAQYADIVGAPLSKQTFALIQRRLHTQFHVDLVILRKVRQDSGLSDVLSQLAMPQEQALQAPFIDLSRFDNFAAYEATFSSRTRRGRRQRRQKLQVAHGAIKFSIDRGRTDNETLQTALRWKRQWLAAQGLKSVVFDASVWQQAFCAAAQLPDAVTSILSVGGRPAAIEIGFRSQETYISYLGTYDPSFADHSVGQHQMMQTIKWCFDEGLERYDLLAPADSYKLHLTRGEPAIRIQDYAVPLTLAGHTFSQVRRFGLPLARHMVRSLPPQVRIAAGSRTGQVAAAASAVGFAAMLGAIE